MQELNSSAQNTETEEISNITISSMGYMSSPKMGDVTMLFRGTQLLGCSFPAVDEENRKLILSI